MRLYFKLLLKEFSLWKRFTLFFIANMGLGLLGLSLVQSLTGSLGQWLSKNSRLMYGADFALISDYELDPDLLQRVLSVLPPKTLSLRQIEFNSMLAVKDSYRMALVTGISSGYPLIGELKTSCLAPLCDLKASDIWLGTEAKVMFKTSLGEQILLGQVPMQVSGEVLEDSSALFGSLGIAPKVYVGYEDQALKSLLQFGSRARYLIKFLLPDSSILATSLKIVENLDLPETIRLTSHEDANRQFSRLARMIGDFLGLMAASVLFLSACGLGYLYQSHLRNRSIHSAILISLGATPKQDLILSLLKIILMSTMSAIVALFLTPLLLPWLQSALSEFLPGTFSTSISLYSVVSLLVYSLSGSLVLCLPSLMQNFGQKPAEVLLSRNRQTVPSLGLRWFFLAVAWYFGLCLWLTQSLVTTGWFLGLLTLSCLVMIGGAGLLIRLLLAIQPKALALRLASLSISRRPASSLAWFCALALAGILMTALPAIKQQIHTELNPKDKGKHPSLFVFDIQPEQQAELMQWADSQNLLIGNLSGMVRARLLKVNDRNHSVNREVAPMTREQEREQFFRRRTLNLSYRMELSSAEQVISGKMWDHAYKGDSNHIPECSLEERYAERMDISLGDKLLVEIHGVQQELLVTSLRRVRWNSFEPNFFLLVQPGVLEDAPQTFLCSIRGLNSQESASIQAELQTRFGNVSSVDVGRLSKRLTEITESISLSLEGLALIALLCGLLVLYSIASHEAATRVNQINLFKVLGNNFSAIRNTLALEFFLVSFTASIFGSILGNLIAFVLGREMFGVYYPMAAYGSLWFIVLVPAFSIVLALTASRSVLLRSPRQLFQESQYLHH